MGTNAIQQIAENMFYQWQNITQQEKLRLLRILINPGDESMLDAFYYYLLGVDIQTEDMVFVLQLPFTTKETFSVDILHFLEKEVKDWNETEKGEDISFEQIDWHPDFALEDKDNTATLCIRNLENLTRAILKDEALKCGFILHLSNVYDTDELRSWLTDAFNLEWDERMFFAIGEVKEKTFLDDFARIQGEEKVATMYPDINMDAAIEKLAEQALRESESEDPKEDEYRLALIKLINGVKARNDQEVDKYSKQCLNIALEKVKSDINWLGQFVTVYTILYTHQMGYQNYDDAHFFADRAIESANMSINKMDPSTSYRLVGNALLGKASIYVVTKNWKEAVPFYEKGAEAYSVCKDYFMQAEALRMCAECNDNSGNSELAAEHYIKGFELIDKITPDVIKSSTFPLIIIALQHNKHRAKYLSDDAFSNKISSVLGKDWVDFLFDYKQKMKVPPQMNMEE